MRSYNPKLAIFFALSAAFVYALMGLLIKMAEESVPSEMIVFFRQFLGFILILPILLFQQRKGQTLRTARFPLHMLRAFSSLAAMYCLVYALKYLPLVDALLLSYTRPLFIPIVIFLWFGKKWTKHTWIGLTIGFFGVIFILKPDHEVFNMAMLIGLASGMFGAIAYTTIRRLTKTEHANKIFFYYMSLSIPFAAIPLIKNWQSITLEMGGYLLAIGVAGAIYEMFLVRAYRHAKAFKVGSLLFATVIFGAIFDWIWGQGLLDYYALGGMALIIIGSIVTMRSPIPAQLNSDKKF